MSIDKVRKLFSSPLGQEVLTYLGERFFLKGTTFNPNSNIASYNEGQRNMVLFCLKCVEDEKFGETIVEPRTQVFFNE